jgi:hypothetical protein
LLLELLEALGQHCTDSANLASGIKDITAECSRSILAI